MKDNRYFLEILANQQEAEASLRTAFGIEAAAQFAKADPVAPECNAVDERLVALQFVETMRALVLISLPGLIFLISVWLIGPSAIWLSVVASGLTILGFKKFDALKLKEKLIGIWKWPTGSDRRSPRYMRRFGMQFFPATA
jgi:hypothetical protein